MVVVAAVAFGVAVESDGCGFWLRVVEKTSEFSQSGRCLLMYTAAVHIHVKSVNRNALTKLIFWCKAKKYTHA